MSLTQEQIDLFWENGFIPCGKVLEDVDIERLRGEYDAEYSKAWEENSLRNLSVSDGSNLDQKKRAPAQMLQIMQMSERNIHFHRLLYHERILDLVQDILGPNLMLFHDQALFKPARTGGPVLWHQDNAYWRCKPANLVSCWLTLDDVDRENGAMQLIPGSHLRPVWHRPGENSNPLLNAENSIDTSKAAIVELPAGGCMLHHCQTLHYTSPNTTERQRRAFVIHFMPPGTRGSDGEIMHSGFHRPILRMAI